MHGDLHFHSTDSDGNKTNPERIAQIKKLDPKNTGIWAMTNHDRYSDTFVLPAKKEDICAVWATEISAHSETLGVSLHVTCYTPGLSQRIKNLTDKVLEGKSRKVKSQIAKLQKQGFPINETSFFTWMDSIGHAHANASNWHIAEYLWKNPETKNLLEDLSSWSVMTKLQFLLECLKENGDHAHIGAVTLPRYEPDLSTLLEIKDQEDILLSIAHPNFSFLKYAQTHYGAITSEEKLLLFEERIAPKLVEMGIWNFEVNTMASREWVRVIERVISRSWGILTFGSDNHGWEEKDAKVDDKHAFLGQVNPYLTEKMLEPIKRKLRGYV
jgi:hypothetical protein